MVFPSVCSSCDTSVAHMFVIGEPHCDLDTHTLVAIEASVGPSGQRALTSVPMADSGHVIVPTLPSVVSVSQYPLTMQRVQWERINYSGTSILWTPFGPLKSILIIIIVT